MPIIVSLLPMAVATNQPPIRKPRILNRRRPSTPATVPSERASTQQESRRVGKDEPKWRDLEQVGLPGVSEVCPFVLALGPGPAGCLHQLGLSRIFLVHNLRPQLGEYTFRHASDCSLCRTSSGLPSLPVLRSHLREHLHFADYPGCAP